MARVFIRIGNTDLTRFANIQNHDVNQEDIAHVWTDGNGMERRAFIRRRIQGTVQLGFQNLTDFSAFTALLNSTKDPVEGWNPVTVYVNNTGETAAIEAFVTVSGSGRWDEVNSRQWLTQTVTITER